MKKIGKIIIGLLILIICTMPYILFKEKIQELAVIGYIGLIIACLISNMSVLIPSSSTLIVVAASVSLNPVICILLGALGASMGEYSSYICGRVSGADADINQTSKYSLDRVREWFKKREFLTVFMFAFVPLPLFDIAGIIAGSSKMNPMKYSMATYLGKSIKYAVCMIVVMIFLPILIDMDFAGMGTIFESIYNSLFAR